MIFHALRLLGAFWIWLLFLPGAALAQTAAEKQLWAIQKEYEESHKVIGEKYGKAISELLASADKVEVYLLDFEIGKVSRTSFMWWLDLPDTEFPIVPYNATTKILKRKTLSAKERKTLLPVLSQTIDTKERSGMMCHFPIHGVRVWSGKSLLLETSFCWKCRNFYLVFPDNTSQWLEFEGTKLSEVLGALITIPPAESARFERMFQPTPKPDSPDKPAQ